MCTVRLPHVQGGAIVNYYGTMAIRTCVFQHNKAQYVRLCRSFCVTTAG
jgi:hypothetical protein